MGAVRPRALSPPLRGRGIAGNSRNLIQLFIMRAL